MISFAAQVTVPSDVLVQELPGEAVLLNLKSERYFGLDDVGVSAWNALQQTGSLQAAYERLLAEYDVDAELLRKDLADLVERLVEHGLLEVRAG